MVVKFDSLKNVFKMGVPKFGSGCNSCFFVLALQSESFPRVPNERSSVVVVAGDILPPPNSQRPLERS